MKQDIDNIRTVIFDLDGTLLDTLEDLTDSSNVIMERFGFPTHTIPEIRAAVGNGLRVLIQRIVPEGTSEEVVQQAFEAFRTYYVEHCNSKTRPYDGILELLGRLKVKGYKTAVVSNKADEAVKLLLEEHFPGLIDASMGMKDGIRRKPAPDSVFAVMHELGAEKESTVYVGDSDVDKATADNAGLACISVTWGFRARELLQTLKPWKIVENAGELEKVLDEGNA